MPARHAFEYEQQGVTGRVVVDGQDITSAVRSLSIHAEPGAAFPRAVLDLNIIDATAFSSPDTELLLPDAVAATLVALGWTPPEEGQPVDLTAPERHDQMIKIIRREARRDPDWFRNLLRRQTRMDGNPLHG